MITSLQLNLPQMDEQWGVEEFNKCLASSLAKTLTESSLSDTYESTSELKFRVNCIDTL